MKNKSVIIYIHMAQKKETKSLSSSQKVGLGIGLTAAAVAAAGAYFLYGSKNATQNRKKVKGWMLKAKGEVLEALEKAEKISAEEYAALVAAASDAYGTVQKASKGELKEFKDEMTEHWNKLQKNKVVKKIVMGEAAPVKVVAKKAAPAKKADATPKAPTKTVTKTTKK
jgi:hypothetical protein